MENDWIELVEFKGERIDTGTAKMVEMANLRFLLYILQKCETVCF